MLRSKLFSTCVATALVIGVPLSVKLQGFVPGANDTKVNGLALNGLALNGTKFQNVTFANSSVQSLRVEGGQLVVQTEMGR